MLVSDRPDINLLLIADHSAIFFFLFMGDNVHFKVDVVLKKITS